MYNGKPQRIRALHIGPTGLKSLTGGTYGKITMDNNREGWGASWFYWQCKVKHKKIEATL